VEHDSTASFTIGGPSKDPTTTSKWDLMQFREPPVPYPVASYIFDRDGDGRGDSIIVVYNRRFNRGPDVDAEDIDPLPSKLLVTWSPEETAAFGLAQKGANGEYTDNGFSDSENWDYWKSRMRLGSCSDFKACSDTIVITLPDGDYSTFTEDIKTAAYGGENVVSWVTFCDPNSMICDPADPNYKPPQPTPLQTKITDRIPPIIVKAEYTAGEGCDATSGSKCRDQVFIEVSEKIKMAEGKESDLDATRRAFAYMLVSDGKTEFRLHEQAKSLPQGSNGNINSGIVWKNAANPLYPNGDSSVTLTYWQYKDSDTETSETPEPRDSVRFLAIGASPQSHAFVDMEGNSPNINEIGREIVGRSRFQTDRILIADADPNDRDLKKLKEKMKKRFGEGNEGFAGKIDSLFLDKPIEFLPIPEACKGKELKSCINEFYPGTVGTIFWPGVNSVLSEYPGALPEDIWFFANSFYHTNLGNFVVKSDEIKINCKDRVFQIDGATDCRNNNGIYLAWDLRDNKNRMVGTGAYVQVYNFRWELEDKVEKKKGAVKYPNEGNQIELFGVRRAKSKE
jgi:hypothetical protein